METKKLAKMLAFAANAATVLTGALQSSGLLDKLSPDMAAIALAAIALLNAIVHAIPTPAKAPKPAAE